MSIFWGLEHYMPPESGVAVTIGVFDGVHLGHQALLHRLKELGQQNGLPTVAITFDRHPLEVVAPDRTPLLLNTRRERAERLSGMGVNRVLVLTFDEDFSNISARSFVKDVLVRKIGVRSMVVGQSFRFGHGREGTPEFLKQMGEEMGFSVEVLPPTVVNGEVVSSSVIRHTLEQGDVRKASTLLGSCYRIRGTVVTGDGRGRQIGFPTANIETSKRRLIPGNGVYAVNGHFGGFLIRGAANIGVRPTMGAGDRWLEVHLVGFQGDLYGQKLEVQFLERLRDERKFDSVEELREQIAQDISKALDTPDCQFVDETVSDTVLESI